MSNVAEYLNLFLSLLSLCLAFYVAVTWSRHKAEQSEGRVWIWERKDLTNVVYEGRGHAWNVVIWEYDGEELHHRGAVRYMEPSNSFQVPIDPHGLEAVYCRCELCCAVDHGKSVRGPNQRSWVVAWTFGPHSRFIRIELVNISNSRKIRRKAMQLMRQHQKALPVQHLVPHIEAFVF